MPRKWSNSSGAGGGRHRFVESAPFHLPLDPRIVDEILSRNARIAALEKKNALRKRKN